MARYKFYSNKKQTGSALIAVGLTLMIVLLLIASLVFTFVHYKDEATTFESKIVTQYKEAQSYLSSFTLKMKDSIGLKNLDTKQLESLVTNLMKAKMGENGSQAVMQWFQDANLPYNNEIANKMLVMIDSGRTEFQLLQMNLNKTCNTYSNNQRLTWSGFWYGLANKPVNDKYFQMEMCELVLDADTNEAYRTKEAKSVF